MWLYCYDIGVRDKIIDCLYVYLLYFLCATPDLLFLFSCYSIRDACTAVRVAQRVCVYEWTFIYISGGKVCNPGCLKNSSILFDMNIIWYMYLKFLDAVLTMSTGPP